MKKGLNLRTVAETRLNSSSSRSHWYEAFLVSIFVFIFSFVFVFSLFSFFSLFNTNYYYNSIVTLTVEVQHIIKTSHTPPPTRSKLYLVDLAGSENVGMSGATGENLREVSYINKYIFSISFCITNSLFYYLGVFLHLEMF